MVARTRRPDGDAELVQEQLERPVTEPAGSAGVHASTAPKDTRRGKSRSGSDADS